MKSLGMNVLQMHSGFKEDQELAAFQDILDSKYTMIYVCPEKLGLPVDDGSNEDGDGGLNDTTFLKLLTQLNDMGKLDRFVLDEVHCVKKWGDTFRKAYSGMEELKDLFPEVPIIGLTATATIKTRNELIAKL